MERVGDSLSLHTVGVSGNVDPCEHLDNFFGEVDVLTYLMYIGVLTSFIWFCGDF